MKKSADSDEIRYTEGFSVANAKTRDAKILI